jgi:hypothetical protein
MLPPSLVDRGIKVPTGSLPPGNDETGVDNQTKDYLLQQNRARNSFGSNIGLAMSDANRLSAPVREAMTIVRSLARLYDNNNACKVALRAYEKAATERDAVELEKWRTVLSGLLELAQPKGNFGT